MDISALVNPADAPRHNPQPHHHHHQNGLPESPTSFSSSTLTRPLLTASREGSSSALDDDTHSTHPPIYFPEQERHDHFHEHHYLDKTYHDKTYHDKNFPDKNVERNYTEKNYTERNYIESKYTDKAHYPTRIRDNSTYLNFGYPKSSGYDTHQLQRPLPPMLAPLTLPPLPSPLSPSTPSPSIRRARGTRPRPFACWCGSAFSKREHLKRHDMLVHKALRPYRCEVCQVDFGTKQNMQVHFTTRKHRDREMFVGGLA